MKSHSSTIPFSKFDKIGQCFHPAAYIHDSEEGIAEIEQLISECKVGGLTFFYSRESVETNFNRHRSRQEQQNSIEKLTELINHYQKISTTPLLISIDAEWGLGMRIFSHPPFPYPMTLAATGHPELCYEVGSAIGKELRAVGIHMNLAPVVDVNTNPQNPVIGYRSFGSDPAQVAMYAGAYYEGLSSEGILGCLKHFPGHGDTQTDSHLELPRIKKDLQTLHEEELAPFKALIQKGVGCVMTGHIHIPALDDRPASLSSKVIQETLRKEMGFTGAVMTDALNMKSVFKEENRGTVEYEAFSAGNDILSFSKHIPEAIKLIAEHASEERIDASFDRIMQLKDKTASASEKAQLPDTSKLRSRLAIRSITSIKGGEEVQTLKINQLVFVNKNPAHSRFSLPDSTSRMLNDVVDNGINGSFKKSGHVLILVFLPSDKPMSGSFGMEEQWLKDLHLLAEEFSASLCLFGNAYALELFSLAHFRSVTLAYQNLPEFEEAAAQYFSGTQEATGSLPTKQLVS